MSGEIAMRRAGLPRKYYPSYSEAKKNHFSSVSSHDMGCVYVVEIGHLVKVGTSKYPLQRFNALKQIGPLGRIYISAYSKHAYRIEKLTHEALSADRIRGEFYRTSFETAVSMMRAQAARWGIK